jgi:hypothetical protein
MVLAKEAFSVHRTSIYRYLRVQWKLSQCLEVHSDAYLLVLAVKRVGLADREVMCEQLDHQMSIVGRYLDRVAI